MFLLYQIQVFVTLIAVGHCNSISCNQTLSVNSLFYSMWRPVGVPDLMFNNITVNVSAGCQSGRSNSHRYSTCAYSIVLGDNVTIPHPPDLSSRSYLENFVAFQRLSLERTSAFQFVQFDLGIQIPMITAIELSFLNNPVNRISLPDITLSRPLPGSQGQLTNGESITTKMINNEDLAETDNQIRTIALQPSTPLETPVKIQINFIFSRVHDFDNVLLSEIRFCTDPQPDFMDQQEVVFQTPHISPNIVHPSASDLISSSIQLVCSVSNEGQYVWVWEKDDTRILEMPDYSIIIGDGSRTTKLTLRNLRVNDGATYKCIANQLHLAEFVVAYPVLVTTEPIVRGSLQTGEVTLNCELHGYQSLLIPPVWLDTRGSKITSSAKYTISTFSGSHTIILENGTTVPSIILSITIHNITNADEGNYTCHHSDREKSVTQLITIVDEDSTVTPTLFTTHIVQSRDVQTNTVVIATAAVMTVIIGLTVWGIFITLFAIIKRRKKILLSQHSAQYSEIEIKSRQFGYN